MPLPDLNLLRVFDVVYTTGAVNLAAERLDMTAPAVSQAITRLSKQIGQPLFVRQGRGIAPTATATSLRQEITPHLGIIEQSITTKHQFDPETSQRTFFIGSDQNYDLLYIQHSYEQIKREAPNVACEWVPGLHLEEERHDALRLRSVDLIITSYPLDSAGFHHRLVTSENVVAVCARHHPRIQQLSDFHHFFKEPHTALNSFRQNNFFVESLSTQPLPARDIVYRNDSMLNLMVMAAATDWLCMCAEKLALQYADALHLHRFDLPFDAQKLPVYLSWHSARENDHGLQWLIQKITSGITTMPEPLD